MCDTRPGNEMQIRQTVGPQSQRWNVRSQFVACYRRRIHDSRKMLYLFLVEAYYAVADF